MAHERPRAAGLTLAALVLLATACASSGDKATSTPAETTARTTPGPNTTGVETTVSTTKATAATTAAPNASDLVDASLSDHECPSDASISAAVGRPMAFDSSDVQAKGFCPYKSADENVTLSVTFTPMDMTAYPEPSQTEVQGLGQKALWNEGSDELVVWFGNGSIIVSVLAFGQGADFDSLAVATNVAKTITL